MFEILTQNSNQALYKNDMKLADVLVIEVHRCS